MLTLPINTEWLEMIDKGDKPVEYRKMTPYYDARLKRYLGQNKVIKLRAGYNSTDRYSVYELNIKTGYGEEKWGAKKGEIYYCLWVVKCLKKKAKQLKVAKTGTTYA